MPDKNAAQKLPAANTGLITTTSGLPDGKARLRG